jgi:hypothetical protein
MRRSDRKRRNLATQFWADEQTWVNATRCSDLLAVRADISDRKMRLFAVECCRAIAHLLTDWQDEALRRIEAIAESSKPWWPCSGIRELDNLAHRRRRWSAWSWSSEWARVESAVAAARWAILDAAQWPEVKATAPAVLANVVDAIVRSAGDEELRSEDMHQLRFAGLLREIAGNPFALATFDPAWRTTTATQLARYAYDTRDFSVLPILADALQDAGCDDEDLLGHLRDRGTTHVRGCWALDFVLGKG